ncbi:FAD-dependent oxidoreductase [Sphingomonas sp. MMS24-J13]|uniref:FAD-dependent oxidoreductase n=1 Tax=Sphingomonas sp. MMS24-J13 TaxID=3238686 RepID=UPI00384D84B9
MAHPPPPANTVAEADVLIIGGGMAATWAAVSAAREGADVLLVDKGFVGTSGVTATGGPNHWWVPPDPGRREAAIEDRYARSFGLAERAWMARIIETTWRTLPELTGYYAFDTDGRGGTYYSGLRGPEYLRALRRYAIAKGVRIRDHHPALELLVHDDGTIAGAAGYDRLARKPWIVRAAAVVLATGGCAFKSGLIGSDTNTGDGYLMAAEAGAELSGMEFAGAYTLSPAWNSTRTLPYPSARFFDADGRELDIPPQGAAHNRALAEAMLAGPVFADLSDAPALLKQILPRIQPASPAPFERRGLDIFADRFEVKLYGEGMIRGMGGLRIVDEDCQTTVPGLFAAGDTATRELIAGATSGGGAQNSAWALTSGLAAGVGAARTARRDGRRVGARALAVGAAGLRPTASPRSIDEGAAVQAIQNEALAYDRVLWRSGATLLAGKAVLDGLWNEIGAHSHAEGLAQVRARETAAMTATARWCNAAALARTESRGMHVRTDFPDLAPEQTRRLLIGGLDRIWTRPEAPQRVELAA